MGTMGSMSTVSQRGRMPRRLPKVNSSAETKRVRDSILAGLLEARFTSCFLHWVFRFRSGLIPWPAGTGQDQQTPRGVYFASSGYLFCLLFLNRNENGCSYHDDTVPLSHLSTLAKRRGANK